MPGVRAKEADWVRLAMSWPIAGARDTDAEMFARKAANPFTAGVSVVDTAFVTPEIPCPKDSESDTEREFAMAPRSWSTEAVSEIEAERVEKKARAAVSTGDRLTVRPSLTPSIPWLIVGVSETEADNVARNAATPLSTGVSATERDLVIPAKPDPTADESEIDTALVTPPITCPTEGESDREAVRVVK